MKQVWIDYRFWELFSAWPGAIAAHVRSAIRIYLALRKHFGITQDIEVNNAEAAILTVLGIPPEDVE